MNTLSETLLNQDTFIRWLGRTHYDSASKQKYFYASASGFEVSFYGTSLSATFVCSNTSIKDKQPYLSVFVDGMTNPLSSTTIIVQNQEMTCSLVDGLEEGYHSVTLLKRSEASDSTTSLKSISTDGHFTTPKREKDFYIEFVAASSSTGFANMSTSIQDIKTTGNSNVLLAYSFLTGYLLDAQISILAASGWGVSRGYNTVGTISEVENIPNAYRHIGIDDSNCVLAHLGEYDNSLKHPNVIVVNLGTNDFFSSNYAFASTEIQAQVEERFKTDYLSFLRYLRRVHPDALIVVAYGLMNEMDLLGAVTKEIIEEAKSVNGNLYGFVMFPSGFEGDAIGAYNHPTVKTHIRNAESLAQLIHDLTGRDIIHDSIDWE